MQDSHSSPCLELFWIPLGAGATSIVRRSGQLYEWMAARRARRPVRDLYHAALKVRVDRTYSIEMGPAWRTDSTAPPAAQGSVGARCLGATRFFRYEIFCASGRPFPDECYAVGGPVALDSDAVRARGLLEQVPLVPRLVWGRDELGAGEMWNSNSVVSWLLATSEHSTKTRGLPAGGRAPGWDAGLYAAARPGPSLEHAG